MKRLAVLLGIAALGGCAPGGAERAQEPAPAPIPAQRDAARDIEVDPDVDAALKSRFKVYEVGAEHPGRRQMLELVESKVTQDLGVPVNLWVKSMRADDDWAFAVLEPVRPGGGELHLGETRLRTRADQFESLRIDVVWRANGDDWVVEAYRIGAFDTWYKSYCGAVSKGVIAACLTDAERAPLAPRSYRVEGPSRPLAIGDAGAGANMDRLTTWAVLIGRGQGCGIDTSLEISRVGAWLDQVAPPGSSDQQVMLPVFMATVTQNARAQLAGQSPDGCATVMREYQRHAWP